MPGHFHYCETQLPYIPCQRGGEEGQLAESEQGVSILEPPQEAVGQFGSPVEEVLLQRGKGSWVQRPKQPLLAEERVVAEQAGQGGVLGHHFSVVVYKASCELRVP